MEPAALKTRVDSSIESYPSPELPVPGLLCTSPSSRRRGSRRPPPDSVRLPNSIRRHAPGRRAPKRPHLPCLRRRASSSTGRESSLRVASAQFLSPRPPVLASRRMGSPLLRASERSRSRQLRQLQNGLRLLPSLDPLPRPRPGSSADRARLLCLDPIQGDDAPVAALTAPGPLLAPPDLGRSPWCLFRCVREDSFVYPWFFFQGFFFVFFMDLFFFLAESQMQVQPRMMQEKDQNSTGSSMKSVAVFL